MKKKEKEACLGVREKLIDAVLKVAELRERVRQGGTTPDKQWSDAIELINECGVVIDKLLLPDIWMAKIQ